jgi:hypothetical protein
MQGGVGMNFSYQGHNGGGAYYAHQPSGMGNSFGPVYYTVEGTSGGGPQVSYRNEDHMRSIDNLFGAIKQPNFNATSYPQFSAALGQAHGASVVLPPPTQLPVSGVSDFGSHMDTSYPAHLPQLTNVRTKADLILLQDRLQKMMQAIEAHDRHSPSDYEGTMGVNQVSVTGPPNETPALTPSSSVISYSPGHSPPSGNSPLSSSGMPSYPHLQGSATIATTGHMSTVPAFGGHQYDHNGPHRFGGSRLQTGQPASPNEATEGSQRSRPRRLQDANIDPALAGPLSSTSSSSGASDGTATPTADDTAEGDASWLQDARLVDDLLGYVGGMLRNKQYEDSSESPEVKPEDDAMSVDGKESNDLYPTLPK